jgi:hypothetical protein
MPDQEVDTTVVCKSGSQVGVILEMQPSGRRNAQYQGRGGELQGRLVGGRLLPGSTTEAAHHRSAASLSE